MKARISALIGDHQNYQTKFLCKDWTLRTLEELEFHGKPWWEYILETETPCGTLALALAKHPDVRYVWQIEWPVE